MQGTLGASLTFNATAITFASALTYQQGTSVPTVVSPSYIPLTIEPGTVNEETVWLTAYTTGGTTGTIARGQEGVGVAHANGVPWVHSFTRADAFYLDTYFDVREFGATGDGVTDDTTAVQNAINTAASAVPGGITWFSPGSYLCQPLTLPPGAVLQGSNGQAYFYDGTGLHVMSPNTLCEIVLKSGSTSPLISPYDGGTYRACNVEIRDLALNGNGIGIANTGTCIHIPDDVTVPPRFWTMQRLYCHNVGHVSGNTGYAVWVGEGETACKLFDSQIFNANPLGTPNGDNGVLWYGQDGHMENTWIGFFGQYGLNVSGGASDICLTVLGGGIFGNAFAGIGLSGEGLSMFGTSIDTNAGNGIYAAYGGASFIGCRFAGNTSANLRVAANNLAINLIGCRVESTAAPYHIQLAGSTGCAINDIGSIVMPSTTFGTAYTDYFGATTAPGFPATTVAVINTTGTPVWASIVGSSAAITAVTLGGTVTGLTVPISGQLAIRIPNQQKIAFTYASGSPTWTWVQETN